MAFLARARAAAWDLEHSPDGCTDPRWRTWYAVECEHTVARADLVVSIVTPGWDGSTWMCHEADTALRCGRPLHLWNPAGRRVPIGMQRYAEQPLPTDLDEAIATLARLHRR